MKTVLITGSSRGIGRETALYFASQGWNVIIHGFRHPEKLDSLKTEILSHSVSCLSFCGDISNPLFVDKMITESLKVFPKIDCLVNNAGISQVGLFTDATIDDWNLMINTNLTSVFTTCKNIIPHMLHYHKGKIINIFYIMNFYTNSHNTYPSFIIFIILKSIFIIIFYCTKSLARRLALSTSNHYFF